MKKLKNVIIIHLEVWPPSVVFLDLGVVVLDDGLIVSPLSSSTANNTC
jgi:hypothetical protein